MESNNVPKPVRAIVTVTMSLAIILSLAHILILGPERIVALAIQVGLTALLCKHLYRGSNWARWIAAFLFAITGLLALSMAISSLASLKLSGLVIMVMGGFYAWAAGILILAPSVRPHFAATTNAS